MYGDDDDHDVHEEMLRHLDRHPPRRPTPRDEAPTPPRPKKEPPARPTLMLRRLRLDVALDRLDHFLRVHHQRGTKELLIIVGRGHNSPDGRAIVGPAVLDYCRQKATLVASVREADAQDGGSGALIVTLKQTG